MSDEAAAGEVVTMPMDRWKALQQRIADLEREAAGAREIARVAMAHTGARAIRAELASRNNGITLIVCDPAGDEANTVRRIAKLLDAALWAHIGVEFTNEDPVPVGSVE